MPGPNVVTLTVRGDPATYVKYRIADGMWGPAERVNDTQFRLHVTDAYELIVACEDLYITTSQHYGRTFADGDAIASDCYKAFKRTATPITITGQVAQAGVVYFGASGDESATAPWEYSIEVLPDTYDLFAFDTANRMAIRRHQVVPVSQTLSPLDIATEGAPLMARPFTVTGVAIDETIDSSAMLTTVDDSVKIFGTSTHVWLPPASLMLATDTVEPEIVAATANTQRTVSGALGAQASFELMPAIAKSELVYSLPDGKSLRADWTQLPVFDTLDVSIFNGTTQRMSVTRRFIEATQRTYIEFETPPDFKDAWRLDLQRMYHRTVWATRVDGDLTYRTGRYDVVTNTLGN